ncbi:hypothetical protein DIPPA_09517 [Diplonema papillatum]|nr:hypothetical protein DIPPA_09517 [Diplonema papillatum]
MPRTRHDARPAGAGGGWPRLRGVCWGLLVVVACSARAGAVELTTDGVSMERVLEDGLLEHDIACPKGSALSEWHANVDGEGYGCFGYACLPATDRCRTVVSECVRGLDGYHNLSVLAGTVRPACNPTEAMNRWTVVACADRSERAFVHSCCDLPVGYAGTPVLQKKGQCVAAVAGSLAVWRLRAMTPRCPAGAFLQSWAFDPSGRCAPFAVAVEYACAAAPAPCGLGRGMEANGDQTLWTACTAHDAKFEALRQHPQSCERGRGLAGWRYVEPGAAGQFEYACRAFGTALDACEARATRCVADFNVGILALVPVACGAGEYLAGWNQSSEGCSFGMARLAFACCKGGAAAYNYTVHSPCVRTEPAYLDVFVDAAPRCREGDVLRGFSFLRETGGCALRLQATCASATAKPDGGYPSSGLACGERRLVSKPAQRAKEAAQTASLVAGIVSTVGLSNPGVSVLTVVLSQISCELDQEGEDEDDLDFVVHPLGFSLYGEQKAGAIVGNLAVCFAFAAFFYGVTHLAARLGTAAALEPSNGPPAPDETAQYPPWVLSAAVVRFPSAAFVPPLFLLPGTLECGVGLLAETRADHDAAFKILGAAGITACLGFCAFLWRVSSGNPEATVVPLRELGADGRGGWGARVRGYLFGREGWVSTSRDMLLVSRYGLLFDAYRELRWVRGKYFLLELCIAFPLTAMSFAPARSWSTCAAKAAALGLLFFAQGALLLYFDAFLSPFLRHLSVVSSTCMVVGLALHCHAYLRHSMTGSEFAAAVGFIAAALFLSLVRSIYDFLSFWFDLFCCWREAKRDGRASGGLWQFLQYRVTYKCDRFLSRQKQPPCDAEWHPSGMLEMVDDNASQSIDWADTSRFDSVYDLLESDMQPLARPARPDEDRVPLQSPLFGTPSCQSQHDSLSPVAVQPSTSSLSPRVPASVRSAKSSRVPSDLPVTTTALHPPKQPAPSSSSQPEAGPTEVTLLL